MTAEKIRKPLTEFEKFQRRPVRHSALRAIEIAQAIGPAKRIVDPEKRASLIDWARLGLGVYAAKRASEAIMPDHVVERTKDMLTHGVDLGLRRDREVKVPGWMIGGAGAGLVAALIGTVNYLERDRQQTALQEAPEEATIIRSAYDAKLHEKQRVSGVNGEIEVDGTQVLAQEYARKLLRELEHDPRLNNREVKKAVQDASNLAQRAFDITTGDRELQSSLQLVAGDAFEAVLLEKELPETAGILTRRPRDLWIKFLRDLPNTLNKKPWNLIPGVSLFAKELKSFLGEQQLQAGNLSLDPRSFIDAGSQETQKKVVARLRSEFEADIVAEESIDATGTDVARINAALPTGLQVSPSQKDATMNLVLGCVLVANHPELAPKVAGIVGVLDAVQNRPEIFGQVAADLPSRRTRRI